MTRLESRIKHLEDTTGSALPAPCLVVRPVSASEPKGPISTLRYGGRLWRRGDENEAAFVERVHQSVGTGVVCLIATTDSQERCGLMSRGN